MKNFKFKWLLLSFILSIASINQMWADNVTFTTTDVIYVKNIKATGLGGSTYWLTAEGDNMYAYFCGASGTSDTWSSAATLLTGTAGEDGVYAIPVPAAGTYSKIVLTRGSSSYTSAGWSGTEGYWGQSADVDLQSGKNYLTSYVLSDQTNSVTWDNLSSNFKEGETLFLKTNSTWRDASANFEAYFFDGRISKWESFSRVGTTDYYSLTIPDQDWPAAIICRMNPSGTAHDWSGKWNQTVTIPSPASKNCIILSSSTSDGSVTLSNITAPWVSLTSATVIGNTQITLVGNVDDCGGYTTTAAGMMEVGFYVGETKYTAHSTDGVTFTKTVSGLTAGTTYTVKAFATNPYSTVMTSGESVTTRSGSYTLKIRTLNGRTAPKIYAWTDARSTGGSLEQNAAYDSRPTMTLDIDGTTYDWYTYTMSKEYNYFSIDENGSNKIDNIATPLEDKCYWYTATSTSYGTMDCPYTTPQLYINETAGETDYAYNTMSTSPSISKTMSLSAGTYTFKILYTAEWYGKGSDEQYSISRTGETTSNAISGMAVDAGYITLNADLAGDYTFTFDPSSSNTVTITYPTAYQVTYSKSIVGTDNSTISAPTASYGAGSTAVTSGTTWIPSGTSVTFAANDASSGYTWKGWYSVDNPSADYSQDRLSTSQSYARTVSAGATIYAVYAENIHAVTVQTDGHGTITTPESPATTVEAGIASSASIAASESSNYVFYNWTVESGTATFTDDDEASTTIKATSTATVQANFVDVWNIKGDQWGASAWADYKPLTATGNSNEFSTTLTLTKETAYEFKVVERTSNNSGEDNRYGNTDKGGAKVFTRGASAFTTTKGGGDNNLKVTPDVTGDYTFTINTSGSTPTITVTFAEAYVVTYSTVLRSGSGEYKSGEPSAEATGSIAVTSGDYVLAGSDVTFTAAAANTGYTFQGWYDTNTPTIGTTTPLSSDEDADGDRLTYTASSISGAVTVYAVYTEDMHTVTVTVDEHGTITTPDGGSGSTVTAGIATGAAIIAVANYGYVFDGWTVVSGSANFANDKALSTTVYATADATIKANFFPHWSVAGSKTATPSGDASDPMGDWDTHTNGIDNFVQIDSKWYGYAEIDLPANTTFYFKIRDLNNTKWYSANSEMTYSNHTDWKMYDNVSENCRITTAGKGTYTFTWNETDEKLTVTYPESNTVTYSVYTFVGNDESNSESTDGGTISSVKDPDDISLTSGKYVVDDGVVTFTHSAAATNYHFAGWYKNTACTTPYEDGVDGADIDDEAGTLALTVSANAAVYAKFAENMTTVNLVATNGSIKIEGPVGTWSSAGSSLTAGTVTTRHIKAVPAAGYYFSGWTLSNDCDFTVGASIVEKDSIVTLAGLGEGETSGQTLTANFVELDKVYFRNWDKDANEGAGGEWWENVYVYFGISWSSNRAHTSDTAWYKVEMTQIGESDVYWAYVPRKKYQNVNIAFSNTSFTTNYTFNSGKAVKWGSYNRKLNMCVPRPSAAEAGVGDGETYYKSYWKNYGLQPGEDAGYTIKRRKNDNTGWVDPASKGVGDDWTFVVVNDNVITYELRIDNTENEHWNRFKIISAGNIDYITLSSPAASSGKNITSSDCTDLTMTQWDSGDNPTFEIEPTAQGIYILTIDQSGDEMKMSVSYPISVGDYRLKHQIKTVRNHDDTKDSAVYAYSDIIKAVKASSANIASMYIKTSGSPTFVLEKCTAISPKVTWTAQGSDLWDTHKSKFNKGNGVYQFEVSITDGTPSTITSLTNVDLYTGDYYIKTDIASGGWTAYKENIMEANTITFDKAKPATFDHSYCHWIESTSTNIKCVIANDYNIAVSDTLASDAILGGSSQTLPASAYVRFSYNSTTNEVKRTYLSLSGDNKLQLEGNTLSSGDISLIHDMSDDDGEPFDENATNLTSLSNFTYSVDVKAREKARVRLTSIYNGNNQSLIGTFTSTGNNLDGADNANTVEILGGDTKNTGYKSMRIIYDFKTNHITAAWLVGSDTNVDKDTALQADLMIIRQEQNDAYQLTFGTGKSMTEVKKVYGAMKFMKSYLTNGSKSVYARGLYWISFPFDVRLSDAFGMGTYGTHWIIEYYDGKERAQKGYWADSDGFWKYVTPYQRDSGYVMKANEGYVLALDLDQLDGESLVWDNGMTEAYLYFPSKSDVGSIQSKDVDVTFDQDGYRCTIGPRFEGGDDRRVKDSYWHIIGVPSYANVSHDKSDAEPEDLDKEETEPWSPGNTLYFYEWDPEYNSYEIKSSSSYSFKAMHSYMVQYGDETLSWTNTNTVPASVAARAMETTDYELKLSLMREDEEQDRTLLRMTNDVNATNRFEFNYDICKEYNGGRANIWTVTADTVEVAGNCLPTSTQTTIVPVGVKIAANGEYTFSMPEGTNGGDVWLIDNANSSRTNLGLMDYTVNLTTGTYEGRFSLEFPVQNVVTDLNNDGMMRSDELNDENDVRKVFVGGRLYILRDGKAYDATGAQVR